jgi:hypothetical protein
MRIALMLCCLAPAAAVVSHATAQSSGGAFSITRSAVAPTTSSSGGAYAMTAVVGQPAIGDSSASPYQVQSGISPAASSDHIFSNGFEP